MYHEESLPGKGCGVVASRDIEPGELIIAESPFIVLPWWIRHSMFPGKFSKNHVIICDFIICRTREKALSKESINGCDK